MKVIEISSNNCSLFKLPSTLLLCRGSVVSNSAANGLKHVGLLWPFTISWFAPTHLDCISDAIQPSHPLSSPSPPAPNLSQHQGLFQWVSSSHQVTKVLELQLQHQSLQWIFRVDFLENWLVDLLAVQGTVKNLLQHHSSKASILWRSAFFIVQLLHSYMTTESITTNKASGGEGIPVELFQILKDDAVKVLHSICQQIWKTQ